MECTSFGQILRQRRLAIGWSQEELAEQSGVSVRSIISLENGHSHQPRQATVQLLAHALDLSAATTMQWLTMLEPASRSDEPAPQLFGREADLMALRDLLIDQRHRLITLCGLGGIGKTCLARAVAERIAPAFRDGACWVALESLRNPEDVPQAVATALHLKANPKQTLYESVRATLQKREALMILDNFEHLLPATALLTDLIDACPSVTWLVTSRTMLRLRAEQVYELQLLALPAPEKAEITEISRSPAVALFVNRCQRQSSAFTMTAENATIIADICRTLEGIPLALELAASRLRVFTSADLLRHLQSRLDLLTQGARDLPERQQTLRATLAWSYALLQPIERQLFCQLAVFAGGVPLDAVVAVSAMTTAEVIEGVVSLTEHCLLQRHAGATGRFTLLETVREYAYEQLIASGERTAAFQAHAQYFLRLAEEIEAQLTGADMEQGLARLDAEQGNLRVALEWAIAERQIELGLRLSGALWRFWYQRGYLREGRAWLEQALAQITSSDGQDTRAWQAKALHGAGWLAFGQGDYDQSAAFHSASLALSTQLGDRLMRARSLNNLGGIARTRGDTRLAMERFSESLAIFRELESVDDVSNLLSNLAAVAWMQGDYARAQTLSEESLAIHRRLGNMLGVSISLEGLGILALEQGDIRQAREFFSESLQLARSLTHQRRIALASLQLGTVLCQQQDYIQAAAAFDECLALFKAASNLDGVSETLLEQGNLAIAQNERAEARRLYRDSLAIARDVGGAATMLACVEGIACALDAQPTPDYSHQSIRLLAAAAQLRENLTTPRSPLFNERVAATIAHLQRMTTPECFATQWRCGVQLALEDIVAEVLAASPV